MHHVTVAVYREALYNYLILMKPRERVLAALKHETTDRIPIAMVCAGVNPPAYRDLEKYLSSTRSISAEDYLEPVIDITTVAPPYIGPSLRNREDIWGVIRRPVSYGSGAYDEIEYYPLAGIRSIDDLESYRWPSADWFSYSAIPELIEKERSSLNRSIMVMNGNIFESAWYMRGFEKMFMDFVLNPEFADNLLKHVTDYYVSFFDGLLTHGAGEIDLVFTADDLGGQEGLLMSREMWERFLKPHHVRLNDVIHRHGAKVIYHTDGAVMEMVDGLIDMGIDILQALQFNAKGMDPRRLKTAFGEELCFEGGVSVQKTLPFGRAAEVVQEVRSLIEILGKDGGYILGPSHAIQAGTPPENIVAFIDTAVSYYPF